ncbi:hypothetical protein CAEBREN_15181 [Caenorhabditis brenneri]|uniref:Uncharacterized protein n=1 Tax=Caenorhabditis brenneri TaxID=135651 RepID=G0MA41_CAEBE|nr:hypothetical protein CAEBREN_15181 [Caenorhabditis brenneri]
MDEVRRSHFKDKDKVAEEKFAEQLRELQDSASGILSEAINHCQTQHLNNLKKVDTEQVDFTNNVDRMIEEDAEQHESKKIELVKKSEKELANITIRCDGINRSTLDNLEETIASLTNKSAKLENQIAEAKAKIADTEVNVGKQMFDEVGAQLDRDEQLTEKRQEEIRKQHTEIQKEVEGIMATERAEKKRNAVNTIAEIKSDLADQQKVGMMDVAIQQFTDERKSRKTINNKINEVKAFLEELDEQFMAAYTVLNASPEYYKKLKPRMKRATRGYLERFTELLTLVSSKLNEIEQSLASFEWEDVEMTQISRQIKTQISALRKIIANLNLILELDDVDIEPAITKEFAEAKETLFEQINNMDVISEKRSRIVESIQQRQEETMPDVAKLSIEN